MILRLILKILLLISIGLLQATDAYSVVPPQILSGISHFIFPISLFFLFSPEIAEISDMKALIGDIQFRILTFITTAVSLLPVVFIKKIILLEYNWLDSVPLRFGFTLTRTWTAEEKFKFLETTLHNIGLDSLLTSTQKLSIIQQSNSIGELQTNLMNFLQQQAAQAQATWSLSEIFSTQTTQYIIAGVCIIGIAIGGYFIYANSETIWKFYNFIKSLNASDEKLDDSVASTVSAISKEQEAILDLQNAMHRMVHLIQTHNQSLNKMGFLLSLTPDEVDGIKLLLKQIAFGTVKFCECSGNQSGFSDFGKAPDSIAGIKIVDIVDNFE